MTICEFCERETIRRKKIQLNEIDYFCCIKCYNTIRTNLKKGYKIRMKDFYREPTSEQTTENQFYSKSKQKSKTIENY